MSARGEVSRSDQYKQHDPRPGGSLRQEHARQAGVLHSPDASEEISMVRSADPDARFLVDDGGRLSVRDREGLADLVRQVADDSAYGLGSTDELSVWRWAGHGRLEPIAVRCEYAGEFDADNYADTLWTATSPDGITYADVPVRVDGRA